MEREKIIQEFQRDHGIDRELKEILGSEKSEWRSSNNWKLKWGEDRYADERRTVIEAQRRRFQLWRIMNS